MIAGHVYSQAPRCAGCGGRALLVEAAAKALAKESTGRLTAEPCPRADGWHVHHPASERS